MRQKVLIRAQHNQPTGLGGTQDVVRFLANVGLNLDLNGLQPALRPHHNSEPFAATNLVFVPATSKKKVGAK